VPFLYVSFFCYEITIIIDLVSYSFLKTKSCEKKKERQKEDNFRSPISDVEFHLPVDSDKYRFFAFPVDNEITKQRSIAK